MKATENRQGDALQLTEHTQPVAEGFDCFGSLGI